MRLNSDIGEAFGAWELADDDAIMRHLELANVACGFHGGDPMVMAETVRRAKRYGVEVGAHPSYPDLQGFGRRAMDMDPEEITAAVVYQCGALKGFLDAEAMPLAYVKPHGALYGAGARDEAVARAVADAAAVFGVPVMGMAGKAHEAAANAAGVGFIAEYYADLEYDDDGFLIITRKHVAYDPEVAVRRARRVIEEGIAETASGGEIPMRAETICVHSDTPGAPELAAALAAALRSAPSRS
jgi:5-oxoprolinase (ATP-hydrolysing) subunit A